MPTIYIDCSATYKSSINTGIQRVVRNLARHAPEIAARNGYTVKLVAMRDGGFSEISLTQFQAPKIGALWQRRTGQYLRMRVLSWINHLRHHLDSLSDAPAWKDFINAPHYRFGLARCVLYPVLLTRSLVRRIPNSAIDEEQLSRLWSAKDDLSNDILLLADSGWDRADSWSEARRFKQQGGYIATVIYDLIPLSHPQFYEPYLVNTFTNWINESVPCVDFYICISSSTEAALRAFLLDAHGTGQTGYFYLGSDLDLTRKEGSPSQKVAKIVAGDGPIFLVVGSLEPRKNLAFVLDAFERVWLKDSSVKLVLVGHNTWKVDALLERIQRHPLRDSRLFWIRDASDTDLEYLYQNATALVFASLIEGFGLPIVEAMQRGLPVLCSDIPVFREIADGKASFFSLETTDELIQSIRNAIEESAMLTRPKRTPYQWLTWSDSTGILLKKIHAQFLLDRKNQGAMAHSAPASDMASEGSI